MEKNLKIIKNKFDGRSVYGDDEKYIKTKIKTYDDGVITNFHNKKIPKEKPHASAYQ